MSCPVLVAKTEAAPMSAVTKNVSRVFMGIVV
jgi:hypothetical protein